MSSNLVRQSHCKVLNAQSGLSTYGSVQVIIFQANQHIFSVIKTW